MVDRRLGHDGPGSIAHQTECNGPRPRQAASTRSRGNRNGARGTRNEARGVLGTRRQERGVRGARNGARGVPGSLRVGRQDQKHGSPKAGRRSDRSRRQQWRRH